MNTETTPDEMAESLRRYPLRSYEVTFVDGRRQRLLATKVSMPYADTSHHFVEFYGPADPASHMSRAGRLLLAGKLGTVIVAIRDLDADIAEVWTAAVTVKRSFRQRLLDALTFNSRANR
jgi:hypothetical protein